MSKRRRPHGEGQPGASDYSRLLAACAQMGFCGSIIDDQPSHVDDYIPDQGLLTADQFVTWVFQAEGMESAGGEQSQRIRAAFIEHMGSDVVDAERLR